MSHRLLYCEFTYGKGWRGCCECGWRGPIVRGSDDAERTQGLHAASLFDVGAFV